MRNAIGIWNRCAQHLNYIDLSMAIIRLSERFPGRCFTDLSTGDPATGLVPSLCHLFHLVQKLRRDSVLKQQMSVVVRIMDIVSVPNLKLTSVTTSTCAASEESILMLIISITMAPKSMNTVALRFLRFFCDQPPDASHWWGIAGYSTFNDTQKIKQTALTFKSCLRSAQTKATSGVWSRPFVRPLMGSYSTGRRVFIYRWRAVWRIS